MRCGGDGGNWVSRVLYLIATSPPPLPSPFPPCCVLQIDQALQDPGIIRNRAKVASVVHNAKAFLAIQNDPSLGSFSDYLWSFIGGKDPKNIKATALSYYSEYPTQTEASAAMSNGLKSRGFRFVGPTICYAFMQTVGMVNDHSIGCYKQTATTADSTAK